MIEGNLLWPHLKYNPGICLERMRKTMKILRQDRLRLIAVRVYFIALYQLQKSFSIKFNDNIVIRSLSTTR
jgi:hypothetical protein